MEPKVSRAAPVSGFCPIRDARRPMAMEMIPLRRARPERLMTRVNPMNMREKYSGGPKARAKLARAGAKKVRPTIPSVPATKEEMAADAQSRACTALLGHFIAIHGRWNRGGLSRDIDHEWPSSTHRTWLHNKSPPS